MARLLGIREAAAILGVSTETIRRLISRNRLSAVRIGYRVLVHSERVEELRKTGCGDSTRASAESPESATSATA